MAEEAFKMAASAASAEILFGVERDHGVAAFPNTFAPGIAPKAYAVAKRPDANELLQLAARGGDSRGHSVGIVEDAHRSRKAPRGQSCLEVEAFHLVKIGRVLNDAAANHPGKPKADRLHFLAFGDGVDLFPDAVPDIFRGHGLQRVERLAFFGIEVERAGEFVVLDEADRDVFHYQYADSSSHQMSSKKLRTTSKGSPQFVQAVEGGGFIAFRQRRVVEDGVGEIFHRALKGENGLADVQQLGRAFSHDVYPEQFFRVGLKNQLEAAGGVAANLAARDFAEKRDAHFVGNTFFRELFFGFADEGNFRDGVNAVGIIRAIGMDRNAKGIGGGDAALLHGDGAQAREADDVADRENVRLLGAVIGIHDNAPARIRVQPGIREIQFIHVALASYGIEESVAGNFFLALKHRRNPVVGGFLDAFHFFVEAQRDTAVAQVIAKRLDHLRIRKLQQARPFFDQGDAHAQRRKHASVLDADDAAAHHDQRFGDFRHLQNLVAVDDVAVVEGNQRRFRGLGAGGDDDLGGFVVALAAHADHVDVRGVGKAGHAGDDLDAVARELRANDVDFGLDDVLRAEREIGHGDLFFHAIVHSVDVLVVEAGEVQHRFANGFAGNGSGVDGRAADDFELLDEGDALAELGGLDRRALARGPGTNDDEVVLFHGEAPVEAGSIPPLNCRRDRGAVAVQRCPIPRRTSRNRAPRGETIRDVPA